MFRYEGHVMLAADKLYSYAVAMRPTFYSEDKPYLLELCEEIEAFIDPAQKKHKILLVNMPPRFGKSLTAQTASEWIFGRDILAKIMTGSYNETLSTAFAQGVRDTISMKRVEGEDFVVYSDIFPKTRIKQGDAAKDLWSLEGAHGKSYLATSPGGTATGFGVRYLVIDDILKNAMEALNDRVLQERWDWFTSTMLQRLEGDYRIIVIMTRWATGDLAGRLQEKYGSLVKTISMPAINPDGSMLCESVLTREDYEFKVQEMLKPIAEANYLQKPIDIKGQLYPALLEYDPEDVPEDLWNATKTIAITDTADTGTDYLCTVAYKLISGEAYVVDVVFTDEDMDETEGQVADLLYNNDVNEADFESNNGGRLFSKNVERRIKEKYGSNKTIIKAVPQTKNKEARILTSSAWVNKHVHMPRGWANRWPAFNVNILAYQAKGKNEHDDAPDVLASIFERSTGKTQPVVYNKAMTGMPTRGRAAQLRRSGLTR